MADFTLYGPTLWKLMFTSLEVVRKKLMFKGKLKSFMVAYKGVAPVVVVQFTCLISFTKCATFLVSSVLAVPIFLHTLFTEGGL